MPAVTIRAQYGPFVTNSREAIVQAIDDDRTSRLGVIPRTKSPRNYS